MKAIAILIVLAGTVLSIKAALPRIGICSYELYNNNLRTCNTKFIKGLQQNPKGDCRVYRESFINCSAVRSLICIPPFTVEFEDMRKALRPEFTEKLMCKKAGLQYPDVTSKCGPPCSITNSEYITKNNDCAENLVKKWSVNRADPTICSVYSEVKKCLRNVIDKYCQFKGVLLELENYQYDNYNPFCPKNVDPTSKVSSIAVSKAAIVISLVVAAIQAF